MMNIYFNGHAGVHASSMANLACIYDFHICISCLKKSWSATWMADIVEGEVCWPLILLPNFMYE